MTIGSVIKLTVSFTELLNLIFLCPVSPNRKYCTPLMIFCNQSLGHRCIFTSGRWELYLTRIDMFLIKRYCSKELLLSFCDQFSQCK